MNRMKYSGYGDRETDHFIETVKEYNQLVDDIREDREDRWLPRLNEMIKDYYSLPGNICGGLLHIVLDDDNIEDQHLHWCAGLTHGKNDYAGNDIASLLLRMTMEQRKKLFDNEDW